MRRNYISPEFEFQRVYGTLNMSEQSSFFGSKMLEIDDSITISSESIIWYQQPNGEQLDQNIELNNSPVVYDTILDKKLNHTLVLDQSQSVTDREYRAAWIMNVNIKVILKNYLFATLKKWRTFEGVKNDFTLSKNVDTALGEYIDKNVINRYKFDKIQLYLQPVDLMTFGGLKFVNQWDSSIETPNNLFTRFQTETDSNENDIKILFYQDQPASRFFYKYYYNIFYRKL